VKLPLCLAVTAAMFSWCFCPSLTAGARAATPATSPFSDGSYTGASQNQAATPLSGSVLIPGPLRPFLRMAGISQQILPEDVLPLLSRNVFTLGYSSGKPTEFLILLDRYVQQARELVLLAGTDQVIRASNCDDVKPLLQVLGYRARNCGQGKGYLETDNPERAFLTINSGFPLPELEVTIQGGKRFEYPFAPTSVPLLFAESDWIRASTKRTKKNRTELIDVFFRDPSLARLYFAVSRLDSATAAVLQQSIGVAKLAPYSAVLHFYGAYLRVRSGRVSVPGGIGAESAWKDLVGANPESPAEFVMRLLAKDRGWLAAYFDSLSRVKQDHQPYFTESRRIRRFYEALRPRESQEATQGAFRPAPGLLVLVTSLQWDSSGEPHVPGNLGLWGDIFRQKTDSGAARSVGKRTGHFATPEQLLEAMFSLSRVDTGAGPLQIYLALSALDSRRSFQHQIGPGTARRLALKFADLSSQYWIFSEFSELKDESIDLFLDVAASLDHISDITLRGNAMGTFQANIGMWQIMARQGEIPEAELNSSWQHVLKPFPGVRSAAQLYDAGCSSLRELVHAAGMRSISQDGIINLLAGSEEGGAQAKPMRRAVANKMQAVLDGQRLVSLDTLLALGDGLKQLPRGKEDREYLISQAGKLREFEMPRPIFTNRERTEWASGIYNNKHTDLEMRTDLAKLIKASPSATRLEDARGQLAPFLRDILVGLNYAYYEPPGAETLYNNPLFVRSHDFAGETVSGIEVWQAPKLFGAGAPAGGGAHLVGSLADLPFVLAAAEQDFIAPQNVQALIWREFVPELLTSAILPRWWRVSRNELHAVTLYQRTGEELLIGSQENEDLRKKVMTILSDRMVPQDSNQVEEALLAGRAVEMITEMLPADTFYLAAEFSRRFADEAGSWGEAGRELHNLIRQHPKEANWERLSHDFGVPHPTLAQTYARQLLNLPPLPAFGGYYNRILSESWDSSNLYWARLADESGYPPVALNSLVPELTRRMVERIFASHFEDWPGILRALRETGEDFRKGKIAAVNAVDRP